MPEAVFLEASELTAIRKAEFAETLRARLSEKVLGEIRLLADMLEGATARVAFEGKGAGAVSENLEEFSRAVLSAVGEWEAEPENIEKLAREQRVGVLDVRGLALIAITKVSKSRTASHREESMTTTFRKQSDVVAEATRRAQELMKVAPDQYPSIAAARATVWQQHPELVEAMEKLPPPEDAASLGSNGASSAPVIKGASAIQKATDRAKELMRSNPDRYPDLITARAAVWRDDPALAEEFQREIA